MSHIASPRVSIYDRYETVIRPITVERDEYRLLTVRDTNALVDAIDPSLFAVDERFPYWADLWASAVEMAGFLRNSDLRGKEVLELGCGLGLSGIAAVRAGGRVLMTDYEEDALLFAAENVLLNLSPDDRSRVTFKQLDWRAPSLDCRFDLIIGADIVYERRFFSPLLGLFDALLQPDGVVVLTDPCRAVGREFFLGARESGWIHRHDSSTRMWQGAMLTIVTHFLHHPGADIAWFKDRLSIREES